ncbi:MAG: LamG domain-containing protein [Ignavibacteriaceae bacterium]
MKLLFFRSIELFLIPFLLSCNNHNVSYVKDFYAYYTSYGGTDDISGPYSDIVINVDSTKQIVFCRETSYLPIYISNGINHTFTELIPRSGDGNEIRPDKNNVYSYVRIVENTPEKIFVHWRYIYDFNNPGFDGVAHEYFYIYPEGKVIREVFRSEKDLVDYLDPQNKTIQEIQLEDDGIKLLLQKDAQISKSSLKKINGNPVIDKNVVDPVFWLRFDEGLKDREYENKNLTSENFSEVQCDVSGNITLWKDGVSGTVLAFDGYKSKVTYPEFNIAKFDKSFTLDSWIAIGAYPWMLAPIIDLTEDGDGIYFGINDVGKLVFVYKTGNESEEVKSEIEIPVHKWTIVAASYDSENEKLTLFIDGVKTAEQTLVIKCSKLPNTDLVIGLNKIPMKTTEHVSRDYPPDVRTPEGNQPMIYGIEGLIDEVKIYDVALNENQIRSSYNYNKPFAEIVNNPDLEKRILPGEVDGKDAEKFGAYYTKLKYHDLWDNLWRTSDYPDVVVRFDELPVNVVYWRGPNYGPGWVTENNIWMSDQSSEIYHYYGCAEHMADKQNRHSHVRIIENHDARVLIHWRYAAIDIMYGFENDYIWADEYHYIYPDGTAIRHVTYHDVEKPGWQDVQFFAQAGSTPEDQINLQALTVANLEGEIYEMDWTNGIPENELEDAVISVVNFKSEYKVIVIYPKDQIDGVGAWGDRERATKETHFAGPWNHWPVSQMPNDGRYAMRTDRVTHSALGGGGPRDYAIYGFTNKNIKELVPLARFWNRPPDITNVIGGNDAKFLKEEKAYHINSIVSTVTFDIEASEESPLVNPAFVLKNWNKQSAKIKMDNKEIIVDDNCRVGYKFTDEGIDLIIWLELKKIEETNFSFSKQ